MISINISGKKKNYQLSSMKKQRNHMANFFYHVHPVDLTSYNFSFSCVSQYDMSIK